jgi:hypothetical protein
MLASAIMTDDIQEVTRLFTVGNVGIDYFYLEMALNKPDKTIFNLLVAVGGGLI